MSEWANKFIEKGFASKQKGYKKPTSESELGSMLVRMSRWGLKFRVAKLKPRKT